MTSETGTDVEPVHARLGRLGSQALLAAGAPQSGKPRLLARAVAATGRDALHVAAARSHRRTDPLLVDHARVVDCSPAPAPARAGVTNVSGPGDLTGIGMAVSQFLEDADARPVVTVDSLSTLLRYSDESAVFRFFAVLTTQIRRADGLGVFLVDEGAHDGETLTTFQQLFDGRLDVEGERARVRGIDALATGWHPR